MKSDPAEKLYETPTKKTMALLKWVDWDFSEIQSITLSYNKNNEKTYIFQKIVGFLGLLSPSRPSPAVSRGPVHMYHVYQVLHPLPHPLNLTFDLQELQKGVRG